MAYIDIYDIEAKLQNISLTATSDPSITEVENMITRIEMEMDSRFRNVGITAPITDENLVSICENIAANGVAAEVLRTIGKALERAEVLQNLFEEKIKMIEENPSILETSASDSTFTPVDGLGDINHPFRRGEIDW
jgi:hypothetical protein